VYASRNAKTFYRSVPEQLSVVNSSSAQEWGGKINAFPSDLLERSLERERNVKARLRKVRIELPKKRSELSYHTQKQFTVTW